MVKGINVLVGRGLCHYHHWASLLASLSHCERDLVLFFKGVHSHSLASRLNLASFPHSPMPLQEEPLTPDFFHTKPNRFSWPNSFAGYTTHFPDVPVTNTISHVLSFMEQLRLPERLCLNTQTKNNMAFSLQCLTFCRPLKKNVKGYIDM